MKCSENDLKLSSKIITGFCCLWNSKNKCDEKKIKIDIIAKSSFAQQLVNYC